MAIISKKLSLEADGMSGFLAVPQRAQPGPAVMWIHHNYGLTDHLMMEAYAYAELGYAAFVPNLYHLAGFPGAHHLGQSQDIQKVTGDARFVEVIRKAWDYFLALPEVDSERVGLISYCMGGRLGIHFLAATRGVRASAMFYPTIREEPETELRPRHPIKAIRDIACPSLVIYGGKDTACPPPLQQKVWQAFMDNGQELEWHFYSGAQHGFVTPISVGYQPEYARRTRPLVEDFLARRLERAPEDA